jgi:hypothetical protein
VIGLLGSVLLTQYCSGDKIQKNEMDGACSTYGGEERHIQGFGGEMRERDHLGYPGIDGRIILRWISRRWALVNVVMNLQVP